MTTQPPTQIGRYKIERELGRGTMGVVYQAQDTTLGRTVALKTFGAMAAIAPHERETFEQRFLSEARIAATLDDPHVVAVYDVGRDFQTGLLYIALEYVRGETLASTLSRGPLPWREAAVIVAKLARALHAAHAAHIVHRDVKPANIMLNAAGEPKIMDFGIAKGGVAQLTVAGQVFGTPAYMSPEQAGGEEVDGRSDVFSLGAVLYELVTRVRPFEGPTMAATLTKVMRDEPRPASSVTQGLPRELDAIIGRALRKQRDARYDSAAHLAVDLDCLLDGKPPLHATQLGPLETVALQATPPPRRATNPPRDVPPLKPEAGDEYELVEVPEESRKTRTVAAGIGVAALAVLGFLGLRRGTETPAPTPSPVAVSTPAPTAAAAVEPAATPPSSAPEPTAIPRSPTPAPNLAVSAAGAGLVRLELRYPFQNGSLRVKINEAVVLATSVNAMPIRNAGQTVGYDGRFGAEIKVPSGPRTLTVEFRSAEGAFTEALAVSIRSGETRTLSAVVDKALTLTLQ